MYGAGIRRKPENGCRGAENGENRRRTAVNRNITIRPRRPNHPPPPPPDPRHTFWTPTRPAATTSHPNHQKPKLPCPPAASPTRPCGHIHRHTASPNRHTNSPNRHSGESRNLRPPTPLPPPPTVIPAKAGIYACRLHYQLPQPSYLLPPTVIPAKAGIYARRPHHHSRECTAPDLGESRNNGCRGAENGENRRRTAVNRNITIRPRRPNYPPPPPPEPPGIPSGLPRAPHLRPAIPTTRNQSCPARRPRPQPGRVDIFTVIPPPPTPYRIPQPSYQLSQPSFRRKPESTPAGSTTNSPNRHSASPQPSFRRKPESMLAGPITIAGDARRRNPAKAGITVAGAPKTSKTDARLR